MELLQAALHLEDADRASDFYRRLLGEAPAGVFDPPGMLFFNVGVGRLLLDRQAPIGIAYLLVDDVRTLVEQLRTEGVEFITEPHVIFSHGPGGTLGPADTDEVHVFIRDSEGNTLGLVSFEARHTP